MINLIKYPIFSAKGINMIGQNKYAFSVDPRLTKPQIKKIFEELSGVKIMAVNTHVPPVKKKRLGLQQGYKSRLKRAIITLENADKAQEFGLKVESYNQD